MSLSRFFQVTGPPKNKDCLPDSEAVVFISISLPFLTEFTCLKIRDNL